MNRPWMCTKSCKKLDKMQFLSRTLVAGNLCYQWDIDNFEYPPFGMMMQERSFTSNTGDNKFGFNGMEKDDDLQGSGNAYNFGARIYDSRLARWLSTDAVESVVPDINPYHFVENNPVNSFDPDGNSGVTTVKRGFLGIGRRIVVESNLYFYGGASGNDGNGDRVNNKKNAKQVAKRVQNDMNSANGRITLNDGRSYKIKHKVKGKHISRNEARKMMRSNTGPDAAKNNFIAVVSDGYSTRNNEQTRNGVGGNFGYITIDDYCNPQANRTTPTHEFIHGLGWLDASQSGTLEFDGSINNGTHDYVGTVVSPNGLNITVGAMFEDGAPSASYNIPGIMTPRGANPSSMSTGNVPAIYMDQDGSINENMRTVMQRDFFFIFNQNVINDLSNNGQANLGGVNNLIYQLNTGNFQVP
jgi:RHS repeat-associated protein